MKLDRLAIERTSESRWEQYRYSYLRTSSEGDKQYVFGRAILRATWLVEIEQAGPWPDETPAFATFVKSYTPSAP